jgi:cyclophilin family peptidyl-prolyl cis-trans isomerase
MRLQLLVLAAVTLAPLGPFGCPPAESPDDGQTAVRGTIATNANAVAASTGLPVADEMIVYEVVFLEASAADGATFSWLQIGGPGVQLTDANTARATFVAPSLETAQTLTFAVLTRNAAGDVGRAEVTVDIAADPNYSPYDWNNVPGTSPQTGPRARAGADQTTLPDETVTLDGTSSSGDTLTYRWEQVSGPTVTLTDGSTAIATFIAPQYTDGGDNELVFELAVTDADGRTVTDRMKVRVRNPTPPQVEIVTSLGSFTIELDEEAAPNHVANFLQYVDEGFYDNTIFHRVIPGFVVQGGGFEPGLTQKDTNDPVDIESDNGLTNDRGTVAAARTNDPNSATSQWYVNLVDNDSLNYDEDAGRDGYTVFGRVVSGLSTVDQIAAVPTETREGFQDVPVDDVLLISATRVEQ